MPSREKTIRIAVVVAIISLIALRFLLLIWNNHNLYIDEIGAAVHADKILETGKDFAGNSWPLMSQSFGGGYTTGIYLYPLTAWIAIFGDGSIALRAFSQLVTVLAIFAISYGVYLWIGKRTAIISLLVGLSLPWSWMSGNMAWDPAITPLFIALGFMFFSILAVKKPVGIKQITVSSALVLSLLASAYSYPPLRVVAPLLLVGMAIWLFRNKLLSKLSTLVSVIVGAVFSIPLLLFMLSPGALSRSQDVSAFTYSWIDGIFQTILQFIALFDPVTLFVTGDSNLRHSSGFGGMLGLVGAIGLAYLIFVLWRKKSDKRTNSLASIASFGVAVGFLGSALTVNDHQYLRAVAAWPFFVVLISIGISKLTESKLKLKYLIVTACVAFSILFIFDLAFNYPARSYDAFKSSESDNNIPAFNYYYSRQR